MAGSPFDAKNIMLTDFYNVLQIGIISISVVAALIVIFAAVRSGAITEVRFGNITFRASAKEQRESQELLKSIQKASQEGLPFETEQLAKYYGEVLAQSKTSFWFSLVFAVIGFLVIIVAAFMFSGKQDTTTLIQMLAGSIIDAVAALFFVQSRHAQKSMADFFDKLRQDRQHTDSKNMCESICDTIAKDALKMQLSIYYSGVPNADKVSEYLIGEWLNSHYRKIDPEPITAT